ncbi:DUF1116 domain-containing protein [Pseudonocardia spinosispora]|uniref:DUF1116 domain-containing protein n=1 Tax=Pseudonocardia spinosispora TaxID=103441 RepID=UPI0004122AE1|nr:DUF1116 domain-containing protein [Pseudonocardia spinosispora]
MTVINEVSTVDRANSAALRLLFESEPTLVGVRPAGEVLPGMTRTTILTSGPPMPWSQYFGGQRAAVLGGVLHEGLAEDAARADVLLGRGEITVAGCHDFGCVGSLAGVTTASMPVLVVEDARSGHRGCCTLFEGDATARLNYGTYDESVERNLRYLATVIAPALNTAIEAVGGIALLPIIQRALRQGDELHSRNTAASGLFLQSILPALLDLDRAAAGELIAYLTSGDYFFLRPAMAAAKSMADRMIGVPGSSVVTAMAFSCAEFGIRVSGTGDRWFRGPLPQIETCQLLAGHTRADIEVMGGESLITEVCGLGAFAQAAAFPLQAYQGGEPSVMVERNLQMYEITAGEHPLFRIPFLKYRGTPVGIDVHRVAHTGITPALDVGIAGRGGGQIGAGSFRAPLQPFLDAASALR